MRGDKVNYREDIKAYIDGELSPERAEQVRAEIETNSALREEFEFMKSVSSQIQVSAKVPEVRGFESAMQAVRPVRRFNWRAGLAIAGVAILLLVFASPVFMQAKNSAKLGIGNTVMTNRGSDVGGIDSAEDADAMSGDSFANSAEATMSPRVSQEYEEADITGVYRAELFGSDKATKSGRGVSQPERLKNGVVADVLDDQTADGARNAMRGTGAGGLGGGGFGGSATATLTADPKIGDQTQVIKSANFELRVESLATAINETKKFVKSINGTTESRAAEEGGTKAVWLTLNVPQDKFDSVIDKLRKLGDVKFEKAGANDVTKSLTDNESTIDRLNVEEEGVKEELAKAKTEIDVKNTRAHLSRIQKEIATLRTRNSVQMKIAATSEINVYLIQKGA